MINCHPLTRRTDSKVVLIVPYLTLIVIELISATSEAIFNHREVCIRKMKRRCTTYMLAFLQGCNYEIPVDIHYKYFNPMSCIGRRHIRGERGITSLFFSSSWSRQLSLFPCSTKTSSSSRLTQPSRGKKVGRKRKRAKNPFIFAAGIAREKGRDEDDDHDDPTTTSFPLAPSIQVKKQAGKLKCQMPRGYIHNPPWSTYTKELFLFFSWLHRCWFSLSRSRLHYTLHEPANPEWH